MSDRRPLLGLLPPLGGGLATLQQSGQLSRFLEQYLTPYAAAFAATHYFSYIREELTAYTHDSQLLANVTLFPGAPGRSYTFRLPWRWPAALRACDVLRVFQVTGAIPAAVARLRWQIPFAVTYGYRYARFALAEGRRRRALALWLLEQFGLRTATAVVVTTASLADHVRAVAPARPVHLIPNSVDTTRFRPAARLPGARTLVFAGRLEPQKNLFMLLEAMARLRPPARLIVAGDGVQREALVQAAGRLGLAVYWLGVVPHEELPALLASADAFVLPSLIEGHPKALLEAMSCGLPVVGLDVPGTRDVIRHGETGLLAAPAVAALAGQMAQVLDDPELAGRLGAAARAWVADHFSAERLIQREIDLLYRLAGAAR